METVNEFNLPLWIVVVDFRKAFDTIHRPVSGELYVIKEYIGSTLTFCRGCMKDSKAKQSVEPSGAVTSTSSAAAGKAIPSAQCLSMPPWS